MASQCGLTEEEFGVLLHLVDNFLKEGKVQEAYDCLLKFKDTDAVEVLWRLAQATTEIGRTKKSKTKIYEAAAVIERALKLDAGSSEIRKAYVNVLRYTGEYEGPKAQVQNSYVIKAHLEVAKQLTPTDPEIHYSLGCWSFAFADIGKVARKLAGTTGCKPPKATYEEALAYFSQAEDLVPNFCATNLLMIGKCHHALGNKTLAVEFLIRARDFCPKMKHSDHEAHKKAVKLLSKLNVK